MTSVKSASIKPIDKSVVNQICSAQVVLDLATVVKELIENSIDAGADSIQVKLEEYGSECIEVIDNGSGVEEINFQALTLKHHTSKITDFADLYSVETFGFRGEALSSLCALSNVTITTQHKNADIGAILKFDNNGIITSKVKTPRKVGTTVRLENLFSTLPIRRSEFLKNLKRDFSKMCNVLYAYGLQSTGIRIKCTNQLVKSKLTAKGTQEGGVKKSTPTTVMDTEGSSVESNIISIFGIKQKQTLIKISEATPTQETLSEFGLENKNVDLHKFSLDGYISSCAHGCGRASSDRQFYYINSRPVDNHKISKLVNDIYHQYNNRQDPFVVMNIKVASGSFDLNMTPDKRQILLQNEKLLLAVIKETLNAAFQNIPSTMDVQNVDLKVDTTVVEKTELHEKLKAFRSNCKSSPAEAVKKELNQKRLDNLSKFPLSSLCVKERRSSENNDSLKISQNHSDSSAESQDSEIVIFIPPEKNLQNGTQVYDETIEEKSKEIPNESAVTSESRPVESTAKIICNQISEYKRKLSESPDIASRSDEENDSKRIKFDEGLAEEDKSKRKTVTCDIGASDIKALCMKGEESVEVEKTPDVRFFAEIKPQNNERAEEELKREIRKESFKRMEIIGQFNLGFIITKLGWDLFIIDQHATDEKYNYETLQATTSMQIQKLFNPERLELTVDKEDLMVQHRDVFKRNGFEFVFNEDAPPTKRISLTSIPMSKNVIFGKDDVDELLFILEDAAEVKNIRPSRVNDMFASRACRKSVMIGTPLSHQEMRKLVDHMGDIEHPWNCPHGRPTMRHLINLQMIQSAQ